MCEHCVSGVGPHISGTPGLLTRREALIGMGVGTTLLGGSALSGSAIAQERGTEIPALGYAVTASEQPLERYSFSRRAVGRDDVLIDILYCGICHTDVHAARNDFGNTLFPLMPGHEIVGKVSAIGSAVTRFKVGDAVGVGCMVDSCGTCEFCMSGLEQFCTAGNVQTYGFSRARGTNFLGGYANKIVVKENFVISIPTSLDLARAAPLLCAGITTFSPMQHWSIGEGSKVAIVGLGGLGHIALKLAVSRGADVTVLTTTPAKRDDAMAMGATDVVVWSDANAPKPLATRFDSILTTLPYPFDPNLFLGLLKVDGTMINVGLIGSFTQPVNNVLLMLGRRSINSSMIGGIAETQQVINYCAERTIQADIEMIPISQVNEAMNRVVNKEVRYRFVIDMRTLV